MDGPPPVDPPDPVTFVGNAPPPVAKEQHLPGVHIKPGCRVDGHIGFKPMPTTSAVKACPAGVSMEIETEDGRDVNIFLAAERCSLPKDVVKITLKDLMTSKLYGGLMHITTKAQVSKIIQSVVEKRSKELLAQEWIFVTSMTPKEQSQFIIVRGFARMVALRQLMASDPPPFTLDTTIGVRLAYVDQFALDKMIEVSHEVRFGNVEDFVPKKCSSKSAMLTITSLYKLRCGDGRLTPRQEAFFYENYISCVLPPEVARQSKTSSLEILYGRMKKEGFPPELKALFFSHGCGEQTKTVLMEGILKGIDSDPIKVIPSNHRNLSNIIKWSRVDDSLVSERCTELLAAGNYKGSDWQKMLIQIKDEIVGMQPKEQNKKQKKERKLPIRLASKVFGGKDRVKEVDAHDLKPDMVLIAEQKILSGDDGVAILKHAISTVSVVVLILKTKGFGDQWPPTVLGQDYYITDICTNVCGKPSACIFFALTAGIMINEFVVPGISLEVILKNFHDAGKQLAMLKKPNAV